MPSIPQHALKDSTGNAVDFDMLLWEQRSGDYNYEKPHRHNFHQVLIFNEGGGTHDIDFTTHKARKRSVHFVAADNVHLVLRSKGSTGCSLLFANDYLDKDLTAQLPFSKTNPVLQVGKAAFTTISNLLENIEAEYSGRQEGYEGIIRAYMQALMLHLVREYTSQFPQEKEKSTLPELVKKYMELIPRFYLQHYNVEQYAGELNISAKHLIEQCKLYTGKTPLQHIREHVIAGAKKLLFHTKLSVKEIAYQLNFDDPANFSKYFKSATGYTPAEYREGIR